MVHWTVWGVGEGGGTYRVSCFYLKGGAGCASVRLLCMPTVGVQQAAVQSPTVRPPFWLLSWPQIHATIVAVSAAMCVRTASFFTTSLPQHLCCSLTTAQLACVSQHRVPVPAGLRPLRSSGFSLPS